MIRPIETRDIPRVVEIYNHYIQNTTITFEEDPLTVEAMGARVAEYTARYPWLIFEEDDRVEGYCYAAPWKTRSSYRHSVEMTVYVDRNCAHKGIGSALYDELIARLRTLGVHALVAGITLPNKPSRRLHERMGFRKVAHFREVGLKFGLWLDVGYWELLLDQ